MQGLRTQVPKREVDSPEEVWLVFYGLRSLGALRTKLTDRGNMADDPEFNKFWDYYPKKKSKGDAYKAWQQEKKNRPPLADVLKAIVVLKSSDDWQRDDGKWIPYPATWIRSWGWADVPEVDKRDVRGNEMWWKTTSGIEAKAKELGMEWDALNGETFQQFAERVRGRARDMKIVPLAGAA